MFTNKEGFDLAIRSNGMKSRWSSTSVSEGYKNVMKSLWLGVMILSLTALARAQAPAVNPGGIVNAASGATGGVAPGSIVSIFGTNLASTATAATEIPIATTLGDVVSVTFNNIAAPLFYVSPLQINAQVPWNVNSGAASVVVTRSTGVSLAQTVQIVAAMPGIFTVAENGSGQAVATDNADGALAAATTIAGVPLAAHAINIGDYLIVWCTGLGAVTPTIATGAAASDGVYRNTVMKPVVTIGGVQATFVYAVLSPQYVGLYQIGVQVAAGTPTGNAISLQIQVNGVTTSNQVTIAVAPASTASALFNTLTPTITIFQPSATTLPGLPPIVFSTSTGTVSKDQVGYQGGNLVNGKVLYYPWAVSNGGGTGIEQAVTSSINNAAILSYNADVTGFSTQSNWKYFDMTTLTTPGAANARGYNGAVVSSSGQVYLVPHPNQNGLLPTFVDYNSAKDLDDPTAYQTVGAPARGGVLGATYGWCTGVFDGTYVYYIPSDEDTKGPVPGPHGNVVRYNTTTPFDLTTGEWSYFNMAATFSSAVGFQSGAYDGYRFIYYVPFEGTVIVRYDTQYGTPGTANPAGFTNPAAYKTLTPTNLGSAGSPPITGVGSASNLRGFTGAQIVWDSAHTTEYLYLVPWGSTPVVNGLPTLMSTAARVIVGTQSGSTWSYVDITGTDSPATAAPNWEMYDLNALTTNPQWAMNGWPLPAVYTSGSRAGQSTIAGWQLSFVNTAGPSPRVGFGANMSEYWVEHDVGHALSDPSGWYVAQTPSELRPGTFGGAYDAVHQIFYPASPSAPLIQASGL